MRRSVAIIGAGFSGSLTAIHLALNSSSSSLVDIYLIDPRGSFGPGLAYSPPSARFKLNVRANAMGALPGDVEGFYRWMEERHPDTSPDDFLPRLHYGAYLTDLLDTMIAQTDGKTLHRMSDEVVDMQRESPSGAWQLTLKSGSKVVADACVLAIGNLMQSSTASSHSTSVLRQPFDPRSYDDLPSCENIFILGSSLTAVDVVLECEGRGFKGSYILLSRHGRFPRSHEDVPTSVVAHLPDNWDARGSVRKLVAMIRAESRRLGSSQPVFDAMRPKIQSMWRHLSLSERKRFLRHARPIWETHRHRIPAAHASVLERLQSSRRLQLVAGRLLECAAQEGRVAISARTRGPHSEIIQRVVDAAFICAGPEGDLSKSRNTLAQRLLAEKIVVPGPLKLGASIAEHNDSVWLIGPLQRENYWEITAVRELREEAAKVAREIVERFSR